MSQEILDNPHEDAKLPLVKLRFASFWVRAAAMFVDAFFYIPILAISIYNIFTLKIYLLSLGVGILAMAYKPFMEWKYGATLGKMAMKIGVINYSGGAISWEQSMARFVFYFAVYLVSMMNSYALFHAPGFEDMKTGADLIALQEQHTNSLLSEITMYLLFFSVVMAAFDFRRQALHDKLAKTFCVFTNHK